MLPVLLAAALMAPAQGPAKAVLEGVVLLQGAPRGEGGGDPSLSAHLRVYGLPARAHLRLRLWKTTPAGVTSMGAGSLAQSRRIGAIPLALHAEGGPDAFELTAPWPGTISPEDRVVVEVFVGRRRVAWTASEITVQRRRGAGPTAN
ncbi:MAG TPA: hypothetical protein VJ505_09465 [Holophagaceae bacterium]|nr:hypothetical protein [Holophagaceae bacterium]